MTTENQPELLLCGTFHLAVNPEYVNTSQRDIQNVASTLAEFQPTKIAIEKSFFLEDEINRRYHQYLQDDYQLIYDEVDQFAFRIAKEAGLDSLSTVDENVDMANPSLNQVFEWAKEYQPSLFNEILHVQTRLKEMESGESVLAIMRYRNKPAYRQELQRIYMKLSRVGDRQHQVGVHWLKQWYHRDLAIAANIARISHPDDRTLVLIGSDHLYLLYQFLQETRDFTMHEALDYLP
ncbi:DUF5694 domain-containing protein [Thalassobacillus sp. CUG 92003]|uniref:DUF5694 domain-containing protein n=1 Tax=Thalassobacillus sp. CUG 92003 TaxID=2736641 RepID=UPI0015E69FB7|nr:DUF5694 domain-containing protein [Thalassobacillus sp. CUG 92003]